MLGNSGKVSVVVVAELEVFHQSREEVECYVRLRGVREEALNYEIHALHITDGCVILGVSEQALY
jgi:hypothetical protein